MRPPIATASARSGLAKFRWSRANYILPFLSLIGAVRKIFIFPSLTRHSGDLDMESWHHLEYRDEREQERDPRWIASHERM